MLRGERCLSCVTDASGSRRSREIDHMLKREWRKKQHTLKILLTGSCESGKSTFIKQIRIINGETFNYKELLEFREAIYDNVIKGMQVLVHTRDKLGIPWHNSANEKHRTLVLSVEIGPHMEPCSFQPYVNAINSLWKDPCIQEAFTKRDEIQLCESVKHFFDNIERIGQLNYLPTNHDILYAQKAMRPFVDHYFMFCGTSFMIMDVGCLQFQKQRWAHCFNDFTSILFITSSCDYDQVLKEEANTNRLIESLNMFERIVNNKFFLSYSIILFLNKTDLLIRKVQVMDIRKNFPEFQGNPYRVEDVQQFLVQCFKQRKRDPSQLLFHHFTTAVDTENIKFVFSAVKDTILHRNLKHIIFL